jgi:hypothetical protein
MCIQYIQGLCLSRFSTIDHALLLIGPATATRTVVRLTAAKFKPLIFLVSGFALSNVENVFILMILYGVCLLPIYSRYIMYVSLKAMSKSRTGVRLGKLPIARRTLFCRRCDFSGWLSVANSQARPSSSQQLSSL